jgi:hypothetical protein
MVKATPVIKPMNPRRTRFPLLALVALAVTPLLGQEVLLRFAPEVGRTYNYSYSVKLDKTTLGKKSNERIEALLRLHMLAKENESYQTRWELVPGRHNLETGVMERIKDTVSQARTFAVSQRYVFEPADGQSLFLPLSTVPVGAVWEARVPFAFADLSTSKPPWLKQQYRLVCVTNTSAGRIVRLEGTPVEKRLTAPLELGQLGIRCDEKGSIVQLRKGTEAESSLKPGDILTAINGRACPDAKTRNLLAERFIEPLNNLGSNVVLTVQRDGRSINARIPKISGTLGLCHVDIGELRKQVEFHLDKGLVLSDVTTAQLSVTYHLGAKDGFIDDYQGNPVSDRMRNSKGSPRLYSYEWRLELAGEENRRHIHCVCLGSAFADTGARLRSLEPAVHLPGGGQPAGSGGGGKPLK